MDMRWKIKNKLISYRNKLYQVKESNVWKRNCMTVSHVTYCAVGNTGDTMLSQCVRRLFEQKLGDRRWGIIPVTSEVNKDIISNINQSQMLVIGGGGLFIDDTNKNSISGWQWACSKELLKEIKVPIVVFSVGYNYFRGQASSDLFVDNLYELVRKAQFVGLRNNGSVNAVKELLPEDLRGKIIYQPCITTLISRVYGQKHNEYGNKIAFNVAFDRVEKRFGSKKEMVLNQIAKAAKRLEKMGYRVIYAAHMKEDLEFIPYLKSNSVNYEVADISNYLPSQTVEFYKNIDIVIGMRGHAQMIPFGMNCGIITLGSHDKMRWFMEDIECMDLYVELNSAEYTICDRIVGCVENHYSGDNMIKTINRLRKCQDKLMDITDKNMNQIKSSIIQ